MDRRLAVQFVARLGKDHQSVGRPLGVFFDDLADFCLHMGLKRVSDVNLSATDLIPHVVS